MSSLGRKLTEQLSSPQTADQRHLETLLQVSRAIGSILDTDQLMHAIMQQVTAAFQADRSTLFLHHPEAGELRSNVAQGLEGWPHELRIADDRGICGQVFQSHTSLCITDTFEDEHFDKAVASTTGYVPRSMLVVPVLHRSGDCVGVLQVMDQRVGRFNTELLELLEAVAVQVAIALENANLYEAQQRQFDSFVRAFSAALDARDPLTALHSINVANYAMGIAHELGCNADDIEWLQIAGLLHDVGKIGTPEMILSKPGRLTDGEYSLMKEHATHSARILGKIEFTERFTGMAEIASAHHERLDGSGYPHGLTAEQLGRRARVLAVADVFDALTQDRHYRSGMSLNQAFGIIDQQVPHALDADCVAALKRFMNYR